MEDQSDADSVEATNFAILRQDFNLDMYKDLSPSEVHLDSHVKSGINEQSPDCT